MELLINIWNTIDVFVIIFLVFIFIIGCILIGVFVYAFIRMIRKHKELDRKRTETFEFNKKKLEEMRRMGRKD